MGAFAVLWPRARAPDAMPLLSQCCLLFAAPLWTTSLFISLLLCSQLCYAIVEWHFMHQYMPESCLPRARIDAEHFHSALFYLLIVLKYFLLLCNRSLYLDMNVMIVPNLLQARVERKSSCRATTAGVAISVM